MGADFLVLACNTLHTVADAIEGATDLPFLHIVDACGAKLLADGQATWPARHRLHDG